MEGRIVVWRCWKCTVRAHSCMRDRPFSQPAKGEGHACHVVSVDVFAAKRWRR